MENKLHVEKMINLLQKATLNWSIPNVRVSFSQDSYITKMRGANSLLIISGDNDIIGGISKTDEWEMNFQDIVKNVKSYLSILLPDDNGYADIQMKDEKIIVKSGNQKTQCYFCADSIPSIFDKNGPKNEGDTIVEFEIDEEFITAFSLIKKVSFEKIYFGIKDGKLFMEAGDKTNPHANNMKMSLQEVEYDDIFSAFDYKSLNNIMTLLNGNPYDYTFRYGYIPNRESGLISFKKEEEAYYLMSLRENIQR